MSAAVRIGTCSWVDRGLVDAWYPPTCKSAEARLRYYAEHFDVVEVNSSYYAIPEPRTVERWVTRTPPGFCFHVKAFGLMTGHAVSPEQLPPDLRPLVEGLTSRGHAIGSPALRERVFARFHAALEPLRAADKLGGILMQYGPGFRPSEEAAETLADDQRLLAGDEMLVEFRQRDWLAPARVETTLALLADRRQTYVCVDAPDVPTPNVSPTVIAATTPTAYVRLHGRNAATWNRSGGDASERFDHYYAELELREWVEPLRELAGASGRLYAMFNTNNADQGPVNATLLRRLLLEAGIPVSAAPGPSQHTLF